MENSVQLKNGNGNAIDHEKSLFDSREISTFISMLQTVEGFFMTVEINRLQEMTCKTPEITKKSDMYQIEIQSNDIAVLIPS